MKMEQGRLAPMGTSMPLTDPNARHKQAQTINPATPRHRAEPPNPTNDPSPHLSVGMIARAMLQLADVTVGRNMALVSRREHQTSSVSTS